MLITVIRHTSVSIKQGICYGQSDIDVSSVFKSEAKLVHEKIHRMEFDAVYSSPLKRCLLLAEYCGYNQIKTDSRLMEINFGSWELKPWAGINDPQLQLWYKNWIDEVPTGGESYRQMMSRVEDFIRNLKQQNYQHVALFTHAGVIRAIQVICGNCQIESSFKTLIDYGAVVQFEI